MKSIVSINMEGIDPSKLTVNYIVGETFGAALERFRDEENIRQEELAARAGITTNAISNYVSGVRTPKIGTVVALCIALRLDINRAEYLLRLAGHSFTFSEEDSLIRTLLCMSYCSDISVNDCNDILKKNGFGKLIEKNK